MALSMNGAQWELSAFLWYLSEKTLFLHWTKQHFLPIFPGPASWRGRESCAEPFNRFLLSHGVFMSDSPFKSTGARLFMASILGFLAAMGPLCTDLYLPALPGMAAELSSSASQMQLSITACLLGLSLGAPLFSGALCRVLGHEPGKPHRHGALRDRYGRLRPGRHPGRNVQLKLLLRRKAFRRARTPPRPPQ